MYYYSSSLFFFFSSLLFFEREKPPIGGVINFVTERRPSTESTIALNIPGSNQHRPSVPHGQDVDANITRSTGLRGATARMGRSNTSTFDLASNEVTTYQSPRPMFVMVPRLSYFPLLLARVIDYFEKYAPPLLGIANHNAARQRVRNVWFESNGIPLRWHLPVGALYDVLVKPAQKTGNILDVTNTTSLPWKIVVHFQSFPEQQIVRFEGLDSVRWNFMSDLKQAMYVRLRSAKSVLDLPKQEQEQLWEGLKSNDSLKFWKINSKLIGGAVVSSDDAEDDTKSKLYRLPVRILVAPGHTARNNRSLHDTDYEVYQRPISAYKLSDDGVTMDFSQPTRIGDALIQCVPKYRNYDIETFIADGSNNSNVQFIVQGINVSPKDDLVKACRYLAHADNFLYLVIIEPPVV